MKNPEVQLTDEQILAVLEEMMGFDWFRSIADRATTGGLLEGESAEEVFQHEVYRVAGMLHGALYLRNAANQGIDPLRIVRLVRARLAS